MPDYRQYFATLETEHLAPALCQKIQDYDDVLLSSGLIWRIRRAYLSYYGFADNGEHRSSNILEGGESGELALTKINEFRAYLKNIHTMTTAQRPTLDAKAINSDAKSQAQTIFANGVLEYYLREKRVERYLKKAAEIALPLTEGFVSLAWDPRAGEEYGVEPTTGRAMFDGDIQFRNPFPFDVIRDANKRDWNDHEWLIERTYANKYDLASRYPELADDIIDLPRYEKGANIYGFVSSMNMDCDDVPMYIFYHKKTEAVPQGRIVVFLDNKLTLHDGNLPYSRIPIFRICSDELLGSTFGYSTAIDLLSIQTMTDGVVSSMLSNIKAFGVQNIWMRPGGDAAYKALSEGLSVIESDEQPVPLDLLRINPQMFDFLTYLRQSGQTISGVNEVAQGRAPENLKSGTALALMASMAIQNNSGYQLSYAQLLEDVGTEIIRILRDFAQTPRIISISGKTNGSYAAKEFTGQDMKDIDRVQVDVGNQLSKTTAGKIEIANNLLQQGLVKNAQEYIQVITTGRLEPMIESDQMTNILVKKENELLGQGKPVRAMFSDVHPLHVAEHNIVIANPELREKAVLDPAGIEAQILSNTANHIMEHKDLLQNTDPLLLSMVGVQPPPPPVMQGPAPAPAQDVMSPENPIQREAQAARAPKLPENPLTGEQVQLAASQQ